MATSFFHNRDGNIAMMFAALCIPLIAAIGMGIDFAQSTFARTQIAEAADAALLAAARAKLNDKNLTDAKLQDIARRNFDAHIRNLANVAISKVELLPVEDGYTIDVDGVYSTSFMSVVGYETMPIDVFAKVGTAAPRALEAMLVLDNTGSMAGAKLTALKDASKKLIDEVMEDGADVKIGVVPFAQYVNVGMSHRYDSWIDVPPDTTENRCWTEYPDATYSNCTTYTTTCTRSAEQGGGTYSCQKQNCDVTYGDPAQKCATVDLVWNGCVGSRNAPYDERDTMFSSVKAPGLLEIACGEPILPLTNVKTSVENKISAMTANGGTYVPSGLAWGLRLISSIAPFTEGKAYTTMNAENGVKAIILMTDGENTLSADYPTHNGNNESAADDKTRSICTDIKNAGVQLYTIAFEVTDSSTKNLLENCASSPENYFDANDPAKLLAAFEDIASSLKELALTR